MDRTQLNIISILLGAAGLFGALSGFNVPEVNMTYWDANLYAIKRDTIESTMKWSFTMVALGGFLVRLLTEISDPPNRSKDWRYLHYSIFFAVWLLASVMGVYVLKEVNNQIARSHWEPIVIKEQRKPFEHAKAVAEQDGKGNDLKVAEDELGQIEKLLWEDESRGDLRQRVERLQPMFTKPHSP
jgi:hypothetical protein